MKTNNLYFINHASFAIEKDDELLLIDPWFEGAAFYNGWSLLDTETSNIKVIDWLKKLNKKIYIWYSHEHSDHLSISFLKNLKQCGLKPLIIYQETLDGRVASFLKKQGFDVIEAKNGKEVLISPTLSITTWLHKGGDSFCLINSCGINLLNLNDCVIKTNQEALAIKQKISNITPKIDILMTQFGYANWAGNEDDTQSRIELASHKFDRIMTQEFALNPSVIIPFASFVYFCHTENFYLNNEQNTPKTLRKYNNLSSIQSKIFFMKYWDSISLNQPHAIANQLSLISEEAETHWTQLKEKASPINFETKTYELGELKRVFNQYRRKLSLNFLLLPQLFELLCIIKPIRIFITDLNSTIKLSYISGFKTIDNKHWQISLSSDVYIFSLKNDYGFNTTHVNGRFRIKNIIEEVEIFRFSSPQEFYKRGFGVSHPITSTKTLLKYFTKRLY